MQIILSANGTVLGTTSWTTGFVPVRRAKRVLSEDDVLATALWIERHCGTQTALDFLDEYFEEVEREVTLH